MKKFICALVLAALCLLPLALNTAYAEELAPDMTGIYNSLSEEARERLIDIGADSPDVQALAGISFDTIMREIGSVAGESSNEPVRALISIVAILLLSSMLTAYKGTLSASLDSSFGIVSSLCLCAAVCLPAISIVSDAGSIIACASNLMLAYIPVMTVLMAASGRTISSGVYYAAVLGAGEGVTQLSTKVVYPLLNMLLGLCAAGSVSPQVNLRGIIDLISRFSKWLLGFAMAIYCAVLGVRQTLTGSLDGVSSKALKFALSSCIPVVGSALSEAFKTVQGSVELLKTGVGVFVLISLAVTFMPITIKCVLWLVCLRTGGALSETLNLSQPAALLNSFASVISLMIGIILCVASIYVISTAMVLSVGGTQ